MSELETSTTPTRTCRKCSVTATGAGDFCPTCGTSYVRRARRPSRKTVIISSVVVVLLAGAGTTLGVKQHQDAVAREEAEAATERQERREESAAADAQQAADARERISRLALVDGLEERITKHAKKLVADDLLEGPIKYSSCTATGGGSTDDLTALTGTFECLAVNKENDDDTASGYAYAGTIDWAAGDLSWQLGG